MVSAGASLTIERLAHSFVQKSGEITALTGIDCAIAPGELVAILGPSGCGKSTLLRIIAGLIRPTRGRVAFDDMTPAEARRAVGMVFQEDALLEWRTILDNVLLPAEIKGFPRAQMNERARELLTTVGLGAFLQARPSELSGGMKQRAAICQALLCNPRLLLMDEPFGALDALTRKQMQFEVQGLWQTLSNTVVLVTHSIEEAVLLADRVWIMSPRPGRIIRELRPGLPRPRDRETEQMPDYLEAVSEIEEIFEELGVLSSRPLASINASSAMDSVVSSVSSGATA